MPVMSSTSATPTFGDTIAVIHLDGVIAGTGSAIDGIVSPEDFLYKLDQASADSNVKAILLRVDSPGGTVAASQEIALEIQRFDKPIIVSSADVNASGAYMISSQCDEIYALPTSAVGSIGVITQIPNLEGLLDKLGIEFTTVTAGEYKDAGSLYRSITPTETELLQGQVDFAYEEFIAIVAEGRDLPEDEVREMATGWAWSGAEAQEMGLVDELGTYNDALDRAAELGGIDGEYAVVSYDEVTFTDFLSSFIGIQRQLERLGSLDPDSAQGPAVPR
jgi:protease-4